MHADVEKINLTLHFYHSLNFPMLKSKPKETGDFNKIARIHWVQEKK